MDKKISAFLPEDFDPAATLMLVAGKGAYPKVVAESARASGIKVKLLSFEDETEIDLKESFSPEDKAEINVGQLGAFLKCAKRFGARYAVMAGQITPKRLFRGLNPDFKAMSILMRLKRRNAETIFGAVGDELDKIGVTLLDARSFLDDSVMPEGFLTSGGWKIEETHLEHGIKIARECARLDIGQGCVVARGSVLAVEAFEGTDKMIERAGSFGAKDALFVKTVKANQDYRFDVPVVGTRTVEKLASSGVMNAALAAGRVIILEREKVESFSKKLGVKIFGYR